MATLFSDRPDLLENTHLVANRCDDEVLPSRTRLPGVTPDDNAFLFEKTWQGAHARHQKITGPLKKRISHELERIMSLGYASQFTTIFDACQWADTQGWS